MPSADPDLPTRPGMSLFRIAAAVVVAALAAGRADAQTTYSWTQPGTGTATSWSLGPWSPGTPVSGTGTVLDFAALFGSGDYTFTNNLGAFTLNGMVLNNWGANTLTLASGSALTFGGVNPFLANNGPGNVTLSGAGGVVLAANTVVGGAGNGTLTLASTLSGAGGLTINQTGLGVVRLAGDNAGWAGGVTLAGGYLALESDFALGSAGLTVNGGALRFAAPVAIANGITANADLVLAGGGSTATLTGVIGGPGGLRLQGYNTNTGVVLQGANTYAGATTLRPYIPNSTSAAPVLTLSGPGGAISPTNTSPITVGKNATLQLVNTAGADNPNRIPDAAPLVLQGGRLSFTGIGTSSETFGNVTLTGTALFTGAPTGLPTLNFGTLTRVDNAAIVLSSNSWGTINSATTGVRAFFAGGLPVLAAGSGTGQEIGIVPFIAAGSATIPRSLTTYDATNGLQVIPHSNTTYFAPVTNAAGLLAAANKNVNVADGTYNLGGGSVTVNSLSNNSGTNIVTFQNGTISVYSGAVTNWDRVVWDNGATLDFGPRTGYVFSSFAQTFKGSSRITGSGGLVVAGLGTGSQNTLTFENTGSGNTGNTFTGGLFLNGSSVVGFRQDNHLGAAGGTITFGGGLLAYNAPGNLTITRDIRINEGNGGFTFNVTASTASFGTATATTTLTLSGVISGPGALIKEGGASPPTANIGVLNLTGNNTYSGGTVITGGTLQFTTDANLGAAGTRIVLNGGTLQPLATGTFFRPIEVNASSTVLTNADVTLSAPLATTGQLYGTATPTLTKGGIGTLTLTAASPNLSGPVIVSAGTLNLSGNGAAPQVGSFTVASGATLTLDNTAGYQPDRIGDRAGLTIAGGTVHYLAGPTPTADPAERFGVLAASTAAGRLNIDASAAASPTVLRFTALTPITTGSLLFSGTNLGGTTGIYSRVLFDAPPARDVFGIVPNAFFSNGTDGVGQGPAGYDSVRGVVLFAPTSAGGTLIDNYAPTSTPPGSAFTTTGATTANTGAVVYDLILDAGSVNLVNGPNAPSATNGNTPTGTLLIGRSITSQGGSKQITAGGGTTSPTVAFGPSLARFVTNSDLTIAGGITLSGSAGLEKSGAGALTLNGAVAITGGPLAVNAGTLTLGAASTVTGGTNVTLANPGTVANFNGTATPTLGTLGVGAGATANVNQNVTAATLPGTGSVVIASGRTLTLTGGGQTVDATVSGAGALAYNPAAPGLLTLTGNNTFAGGVTGNANARYVIAHPAGFGTGAVNVSAQNTSSTFDTPTVGFDFGPNGVGTVPNNFALSGTAGIDTVFAAQSSTGQTITLTGVISGGNAGSRLTWNESGSSHSNVLVLANPNNTYLGTTRIDFGTVAITANGSLGSAANAVILNNGSLPGGGSLRFDAAGITLNRAVAAASGGASVNTNGNTGTIAGVLSGADAFTKLGAGTLVLSNTGNTYTGPLTVDAGTLLVNGNLPGTAAGAAAAVNPGGTLGGSGTVGSSGSPRHVSVLGGGTLTGGNPAAAAGSAPGTLTIDGNIGFAAGADFRVRLTGGAAAGLNTGGSSGGTPTSPANNGFLIHRPGGSFTFNPGADVVIDGTGVTFTPGQAYSYRVVQTGAATGLTFTDPARFQPIGFDASGFSLNESGGVLYLNFTVTPVPEPAAVLGLAAAGLGLGSLVRRKLRRTAP
jgi:fibronectin-binding autotransporter adhesin